VKKAKIRTEVRRLLSLPWAVELRRNHDGTFFARVVELPGCMTEGVDEHEALRNLREAQELWLESELARGAPIPEPGPSHRHSGKFTVRTSVLVHRLAAETAKRLGVSLNEFASEALALTVGASGAVPVLDGRARKGNRSEVHRVAAPDGKGARAHGRAVQAR